MGGGVPERLYRENEQVVAYIIGDLRSVPGFIPKRFIRSQLKKNPPPVGIPIGLERERYISGYQTEKKETYALPHLAGRHDCIPPKIRFQTGNLRRT